jgi:hypothetical protein
VLGLLTPAALQWPLVAHGAPVALIGWKPTRNYVASLCHRCFKSRIESMYSTRFAGGRLAANEMDLACLTVMTAFVGYMS